MCEYVLLVSMLRVMRRFFCTCVSCPHTKGIVFADALQILPSDLLRCLNPGTLATLLSLGMDPNARDARNQPVYACITVQLSKQVINLLTAAGYEDTRWELPVRVPSEETRRCALVAAGSPACLCLCKIP